MTPLGLTIIVGIFSGTSSITVLSPSANPLSKNPNSEYSVVKLEKNPAYIEILRSSPKRVPNNYQGKQSPLSLLKKRENGKVGHQPNLTDQAFAETNVSSTLRDTISKATRPAHYNYVVPNDLNKSHNPLYSLLPSLTLPPPFKTPKKYSSKYRKYNKKEEGLKKKSLLIRPSRPSPIKETLDRPETMKEKRRIPITLSETNNLNTEFNKASNNWGVSEELQPFSDLGRFGDGDRTHFQEFGMSGPHSYKFGYDTGKGENRHFRFEERDSNGNVRGHYGFYDQDGKMSVIHYEADPHNGYRAIPYNTENNYGYEQSSFGGGFLSPT